MLVVIGTLGKSAATRNVLQFVASELKNAGCHVDVLDLLSEPLPLFNPDSAHSAESFPSLKARVDLADVLLLGTPDYHGSISSTLKNFLDHFWQEFAGKLFATIVASHEKGLTVTDQLRTVARQCYAWSMPYGVSFVETEDVKGDKIASDAFKRRVEMFTRDVRIYGEVLAKQRRADLAGTGPGFLAKHRVPAKN